MASASSTEAVVVMWSGATPHGILGVDGAASGKGRLLMMALALLACVIAMSLALVAMTPHSAEAATSNTQTVVKIGSSRFVMKLSNNSVAAAFRSYLSKNRTLRMSELNGNEKYRYLSKSFPAKPKRYKKVRAGDVMLYGDDCLVVFYKTHMTSYEYTKIGHLTSTKGLAKALGKKSVKVRFSKMKQVKKTALRKNSSSTEKLRFAAA